MDNTKRTTTFENAKVGDKCWSAIFGEGMIIEINPAWLNPIVVRA